MVLPTWHEGTSTMTTRLPALLALTALVLLHTSLARGEEATASQESPTGKETLQEVVVTATRTRTNEQDVTTTVSVIDDDAIRDRDAATATEALRGSPGLDITQFGSLGQTSLASIRGAAPDQVLVQLDGVQVNTPTVGQYDFANLTTDAVDRIEVLRGGGGTLYGSEAIGGVINVLSRRGTGPLTLTGSASGGRAATTRELLNLNGAQGIFAVDGTLSYLASNGFQENDDYQNFSTVWRGDADLAPGGTFSAFARYTGSRRGLPQFNVVDDVLDPDAYDRSDFVLVKGQWEQTVLDSLTYRGSVAWWRNYERFRDNQIDSADDEPESVPAVIGKFDNQLIQADTQVDYAWLDVAISTVGLEFIERSADVFQFIAADDDEEEDDDINLGQRVRPYATADRRTPGAGVGRIAGEAEDDGEKESFSANRSNVGVFLEQQLALLDGDLRGVGGVRYDHFDGFGGQVTWSGSGTYLVQPLGTKLRLSYATGFRAPTFDELFQPTLGNPDLAAETSQEVDLGFTQQWLGNRLSIEPTLFYRTVDNLIEEIADELPGPIAGVPEGEAAENFDASFLGTELIAHAQPLSWLSLAANYTSLNIGKDTGPLVNRPRHRGAFFATAARDDLFAPGDHGTAAVQVYAVGQRFSPDPFSRPVPFEPEELGGYTRVDLALTYRLSGLLAPLTVSAAVRNLFNADYQESIGFPAPPAWFVIGFRYAFPIAPVS